MENQRKKELLKLLKRRFPSPPDFLKRAGFTKKYVKLIQEYDSYVDVSESFWYLNLMAYMLYLKGKFHNSSVILKGLLNEVSEDEPDKLKLLKFNLAMIYFNWSAEIKNKRKNNKIAPLELKKMKNADKLFKEVIGLVKADKNRVKVRIHIGYGFFLAWKRKYDESIKSFERSVLLSNKLGLWREEALCHDGMGVNYKLLSEYNEALHCFRIALGIYRKFDDKQGILESEHNIALTSWDKDRGVDQTIEKMVACFDYFKEHGDYKVAAGICRNISRVYLESGDASQANDFFAKAKEMTNEFQ